MSEVDDIKADLVAAKDDLTNISAGVNNQNTLIANLQAQLAAVTAGAISQADLDALKATADDLKAQADATAALLPPPPASNT